jgi:dienelactone hydrolase
MQRTDVSFPSGSDTCAAWLYRPAGVEGPVPIVVMAHGLGLIKEAGLAPYAERFVEAGFAVLVFDYRGFGGSGGSPRQWLDIRRQLADWRAALDYVERLDGIDHTRIAIFGTSFSGGHVIRTAAADTRVAAAIAQCPFTSGPASTTTIGVKGLVKMVPSILHDAVLGRFGLARGVALAGSPGDGALMNAPDVVPGYFGIIPPGAEFDDHVDGRIALHVPLNIPGRAAKLVTVPILFGICDNDSVAPAGPTTRYAKQAPKGEIKHYPVGHFEVYVGQPFQVAVADYVEFLTRHLG